MLMKRCAWWAQEWVSVRESLAHPIFPVFNLWHSYHLQDTNFLTNQLISSHFAEASLMSHSFWAMQITRMWVLHLYTFFVRSDIGIVSASLCWCLCCSVSTPRYMVEEEPYEKYSVSQMTFGRVMFFFSGTRYVNIEFQLQYIINNCPLVYWMLGYYIHDSRP